MYRFPGQPLQLLLPFSFCHPVGICFCRCSCCCLFYVVILSEAKNPCICLSRTERSDVPFKNKSQKSAKNPSTKTSHSRNHLIHTIHHNLTTKTPHRNTNFPKNPSKNTTPPRHKKRKKSLRPRMRLVINPLHLTHRQLRIPLRSRKPLMPQHLLNRPQIRPFLEHKIGRAHV